MQFLQQLIRYYRVLPVQLFKQPALCLPLHSRKQQKYLTMQLFMVKLILWMDLKRTLLLGILYLPVPVRESLTSLLLDLVKILRKSMQTKEVICSRKQFLRNKLTDIIFKNPELIISSGFFYIIIIGFQTLD